MSLSIMEGGLSIFLGDLANFIGLNAYYKADSGNMTTDFFSS
jgi:hypothetical protein